jgi:hypothetical protein
MEPECLLPHSKVPETCPYLKPDQPLSWPPCNFLSIHRNIFFIHAWIFLIVSSPQVSPPNPVYTTPPYHTCSAYPILLNFITQIIFGETYRSLASHCVVFSTPMLLRPPKVQRFSSAPYSQTSSAYVFFLQCKRLFSQSYKTTRKIIILYILIFMFLDNKLEDNVSTLNDS